MVFGRVRRKSIVEGSQRKGSGNGHGVLGRDYLVEERDVEDVTKSKRAMFGRKSKAFIVAFKKLPKLKRVKSSERRNLIVNYKVQQCQYIFHFQEAEEIAPNERKRRKRNALNESSGGALSMGINIIGVGDNDGIGGGSGSGSGSEAKELLQAEEEAREGKKDILEELAKFIVRSNMRPLFEDHSLSLMIQMIGQNLFQALPTEKMPRPFEKKKGVFLIDVEAPGWAHLGPCYALLQRLLECCGDEPHKVDPFRQQFVVRVRKDLDGQFVTQLIRRLRSQDHRERKCAEDALLLIYTHFTSLRRCMVSEICNVLMEFISDPAQQTGYMAGTQIASLLQVCSQLCNVFGFVSADPSQNLRFYSKALLPLCRPPIECIARYHEMWFAVCEQFIQNKPSICVEMVGLMLRVWPRQDSSKQALFLFHLHGVFTCLSRVQPPPPDSIVAQGMMNIAPLQLQLAKRIATCINDEHCDVSSDAVYLLNSDAVFDFFRRPGPNGLAQTLPALYPTMNTVMSMHDSECVKDAVREMLIVLQQDNKALYASCVADNERKVLEQARAAELGDKAKDCRARTWGLLERKMGQKRKQQLRHGHVGLGSPAPRGLKYVPSPGAKGLLRSLQNLAVSQEDMQKSAMSPRIGMRGGDKAALLLSPRMAQTPRSKAFAQVSARNARKVSNARGTASVEESDLFEVHPGATPESLRRRLRRIDLEKAKAKASPAKGKPPMHPHGAGGLAPHASQQQAKAEAHGAGHEDVIQLPRARVWGESTSDDEEDAEEFGGGGSDVDRSPFRVQVSASSPIDEMALMRGQVSAASARKAQRAAVPLSPMSPMSPSPIELHQQEIDVDDYMRGGGGAPVRSNRGSEGRKKASGAGRSGGNMQRAHIGRSAQKGGGKSSVAHMSPYSRARNLAAAMQQNRSSSRPAGVGAQEPEWSDDSESDRERSRSRSGSSGRRREGLESAARKKGSSRNEW